VLRGVQSEVEHLSRMVDQLLLLAQADAGNLAPLLSEIDVADFIEEEAARWAPLARAQSIGLDVRAPESGTLSADPDLLRRVMDNLLDNAIRHSSARTPVELSARHDNGSWLLEVADQGQGVPEELRPRIFERFSRADTVRTRRGGGAGLGLALSAAIAEAHGGSLELVPREGAGALFQLRLPAPPGPDLYPG
jgi:two-component system OmpR family sensor kinase